MSVSMSKLSFYFLKIFKKLTLHISETDHPITEKF